MVFLTRGAYLPQEASDLDVAGILLLISFIMHKPEASAGRAISGPRASIEHMRCFNRGLTTASPRNRAKRSDVIAAYIVNVEHSASDTAALALIGCEVSTYGLSSG